MFSCFLNISDIFPPCHTIRRFLIPILFSAFEVVPTSNVTLLFPSHASISAANPCRIECFTSPEVFFCAVVCCAAISLFFATASANAVSNKSRSFTSSFSSARFFKPRLSRTELSFAIMESRICLNLLAPCFACSFFPFTMRSTASANFASSQL